MAFRGGTRSLFVIILVAQSFSRHVPLQHLRPSGSVSIRGFPTTEYAPPQTLTGVDPILQMQQQSAGCLQAVTSPDGTPPPSGIATPRLSGS